MQAVEPTEGMAVPVSGENFPVREGENSHSASLAKEMKTVKGQRDEGLTSTRDYKEVTRNGGIRESSQVQGWQPFVRFPPNSTMSH
jgi:hypothetical protein